MMKGFLLLICLALHVPLVSVEKLVIIGKGAAGSTAAIFAAQSKLSPLVIDGQKQGDIFLSSSRIENYPGFPEGIEANELLARMHLQAEKFGARFSNSSLAKVNLLVRPFELILDNGAKILTQSLIVAMGSSPKWLEIPHEAELIGHGVSSNAAIDGRLFKGKSVIVVGGGDSALVQALCLAEYANSVTIFHRGRRLQASAYLLEKANQNPKIDIHLKTHIQIILGKEAGCVKGVIFQNLETRKQGILTCEGVFVAIGRRANTELFAHQLKMDASGFILTEKGTAKTNIAGVFAAGDTVFQIESKLITSAASGCIAAIEAIHYLTLTQ